MANDIIAKLADGTELHFPEGTTPDVVSRVVKSHVAGAAPGIDIPDANAQAKQQLLNATPLGSNPVDLADQKAALEGKGLIPQANPDLGKLAPVVGSGIGMSALDAGAGIAGRAIAAGGGAAAGDLAQQATTGHVDPSQVAKTGLAFAGGEGAGGLLGKYVGSPLLNWIGASKTGGAQALQLAADKAGSAPVNLSPETDKLLEKITTQGKLGGNVPKVVSDLLERVGPSTKDAADAVKGPLTYGEARILQSNLSALSTNEKMALKGEMKSLMPQLAKSFSGDVQAGADDAGVGTLHRMGMQQYATASAKQRVLDNVKDFASSKAVQYGAGGLGLGAGEELIRRFLKK